MRLPVLFFDKLLTDGTRLLGNLLKDRIIFSFDVDKLKFRLETVWSEFFKHTPESAGYGLKGNSDNPKVTILNGVLDQEFIDSTVYNGTLIVAVSTVKYSEDNKFDNRPQIDRSIKMYCLNTKCDKKNMMRFINLMVKRSVEVDRNDWMKSIISLDGSCPNTCSQYNRIRTFDDVFIKHEQQQKLINSVDKFVSKRKWYLKHNIPSHFGILLYGEPGTGKSAVTQAIASHLRCSMYVMNGDDIENVQRNINDLISVVPPFPDVYRILVIEDIDCGVEYMNRTNGFDSAVDYKQQRKRPGLASVLNTLDGLNAPMNVIYIFTTNHIDKLDPALIRPGRIDLKMEIGFVCNETLDKFTMAHYNRHIPDDLIIKDNLTFAELQVKCMEGMKFKEFIEYVRK